MAAEVAARPQADRPAKRRPFSDWVKKLANFKGGDQQGNNRKSGIPLTNSKHKKSNTYNGSVKNNPYPESGALRQHAHSPASSDNGQLSFAPTSSSGVHHNRGSYTSIPVSGSEERELGSNGSKSGAPTVETHAGTVHSDAGQSRAPTTATGAGGLSSIDGAGAGSTFSSPNHSERSLTTTLTTIQSQSHNSAQHNGPSIGPTPNHHGSLNNPNPIMFSHQYPVTPGHASPAAISAIPRHITEAIPTNYSSATANNLLSDNASILTLASSSKRRRRSMDTDASVRAIPPSSVWGGSRESLPLSVLSGNFDSGPSSTGLYPTSQGRPGGLAERASIYSNQGVSAPALASERNSYYAASHKQPVKDLGDAKSLRSITNLDARSQYDARSINDAKSMDVGSQRNYEGSVRSGAPGHGRTDSIPGSIGTPLASPGLKQGPGVGGILSRRSSDWQEVVEREHEHEPNLDGKDGETA